MKFRDQAANMPIVKPVMCDARKHLVVNGMQGFGVVEHGRSFRPSFGHDTLLDIVKERLGYPT